jgi:lipopolysaccharide transport system ATP-binding protein
MRPAIRASKLSKQYRIGTSKRPADRQLREIVSEGTARLWCRLRGQTPPTPDYGPRDGVIWALKDVSFDVIPGEVIGIIGRNGAGKSTLLKVLSRITEPTSGRAEMRGRLGSLLEVGTGFHPDLTGRENVYLNGSILGMHRREIRRKFSEIVAFSELEEFLDTPVKRYSSGMYVRLAFAVAAHLEPHVLIVDEVLAVGDASYQRRCLDRMSKLAASGVTVVFVSHNMDMIPSLCKRAILLNRGQVLMDGGTREVLAEYLHAVRTESGSGDLSTARRSGDGRALFTNIRLIDDQGNELVSHRSGDDLRLYIELEAREDINDVALEVAIQSIYGARLITSWTREAGFPVNLKKDKNAFQCCFRQARLRPGHQVIIGLKMATQSVIDDVHHALILDIDASESTRHLATDGEQGTVALDYDWSLASPCC